MRRGAHRTPREGPSWAGARDPHPLAAAASGSPRGPSSSREAAHQTWASCPRVGPTITGSQATCLGPCPTRRGDSRDFPICSSGARNPDGTGHGARLPPHSGDRPCGSEAPSWGRSPPSWGRRRRRPWGHELSVRGGTLLTEALECGRHPFSSTFRRLGREKPQTCAGVSATYWKTE